MVSRHLQLHGINHNRATDMREMIRDEFPPWRASGWIFIGMMEMHIFHHGFSPA
jgi:hypothetical protein